MKFKIFVELRKTSFVLSFFCVFSGGEKNPVLLDVYSVEQCLYSINNQPVLN